MVKELTSLVVDFNENAKCGGLEDSSLGVKEGAEKFHFISQESSLSALCQSQKSTAVRGQSLHHG